MNDLLRRALADARLSEQDIAEQLGVDPKTVQRWLKGRLPYRRHRSAVARLLSANEADIWPQAAKTQPSPEPPGSEVLAVYPHRWAVPRIVWHRLFEEAQEEIGILVYAGLFLVEDQGITRTLAAKARNGVTIRILLGDPDGSHITARGNEEGVGDSLAAKVRNALFLYEPLCEIEGVELRLHNTILYNSIYRADNDLLINPHAHGIPASHAPVLHLRQAEDANMTTTYLKSLEQVWRNAVGCA